MLSRSTAEAFLAEFLAARRDPAAGAALLAMQAPEAAILVAGRPDRQAAADAWTYEASHRRAVEGQRAGDPAFPLDGAFELASWEGDAEQGVAWLRHDDPARGASLWVACGLVAGPDGSPRLAWAILAEKPEGVDFAKGRALGLAEFPALRSQAGRPNRDWLDVAYRRRHGVARPALQFLPDARFSCQGSGDCCKMAWEVTVEAEAQDLIDAMPWETLAPHLVGTKLPPKGFGQLVLKGRDETCRFLNEKNHCRIHGYLGTPVFATCSSYPYRFTETPEGVAVSNSFFCGSVREACGSPLETQAPDLYERLFLAGAMSQPAVLRLTPEQDLDWPAFRDLEAAIRLEIGRADRPMADRLWAVSRLLEAAVAGDPADPTRFHGEVPPPLDDEEREMAETLMAIGRSLIGQLDATRLGDALSPPGGFAWAGAPLEDERFVARWFETMHFAKDLAYGFDLVTAHGVMVLLYHAALALEQAHGGTLPEEAKAVLGYVTGHHLLTDLLELAFERQPGLRGMLANPAAGALVLRGLRLPDTAPV